MPLSSSLARDYLVVDDTSAATYTAHRQGGDVTVSLVGVDLHEVTVTEVTADGALIRRSYRRAYLPHDQLDAASVEPAEGDSVTVDGVTWYLTANVVLDDVQISYEAEVTKAR